LGSLWYYGDPLPNTFYLKMSGYPVLLRMSRGLYVVLDFLWGIAWMLALVLLGSLWLQRGKPLLLLLLVFGGQVAYSIYVGGDAWEWWGGANRYISVAMPAFFIAVSLTWESAVQHLRDMASSVGLRLAEVSLVPLVFIAVTGLPMESRQSWAEYVLLREPLHVSDNTHAVQLAQIVTELTTNQASIGVVTAGAIPYFADRHAVDLLGKNDRQVAHLQMRVPTGQWTRLTGFYPGHLKWDYAYSIGLLKPDVVVQLWRSSEEAEPFLDRDYTKVNVQGFSLYILKGSAHILWDRVDTAKQSPCDRFSSSPLAGLHPQRKVPTGLCCDGGLASTQQAISEVDSIM